MRNTPVPGRKPAILNGVPDEEVKNMIRGFEEDVPYFYKDTAGNVTIGTGKLVPSAEDARKLPLKVYGQGNKAMREALPQEKEHAYFTIGKMPYGKDIRHTQFAPERIPGMPNLRLDSTDMDAFLEQSLRESASELRRKFSDFEDIPKSAQKELLDMQYNLGGHKFRERYIDNDGVEKGWPKLFRSVKKRDWDAEAQESNRMGIHETRNAEIRKMLVDAKNQ
ncbi:MAG: hypothetical protein HY370_02740 [Proteobacteria bacterium]|nr:hypothetical protein [Pseudomonadota bacterium]